MDRKAVGQHGHGGRSGARRLSYDPKTPNAGARRGIGSEGRGRCPARFTRLLHAAECAELTYTIQFGILNLGNALRPSPEYGILCGRGHGVLRGAGKHRAGLWLHSRPRPVGLAGAAAPSFRAHGKEEARKRRRPGLRHPCAGASDHRNRLHDFLARR